MYQTAGAGSGGQGGPTAGSTGSSGGGSKDDVIEAEVVDENK
jgi:hypothetical protein